MEKLKKEEEDDQLEQLKRDKVKEQKQIQKLEKKKEEQMKIEAEKQIKEKQEEFKIIQKNTSVSNINVLQDYALGYQDEKAYLSEQAEVFKQDNIQK